MANLNSPFAVDNGNTLPSNDKTNSALQPNTPQEQFTIHTMHDDLALAGSQPSDKTQTPIAPQQSNPSPYREMPTETIGNGPSQITTQAPATPRPSTNNVSNSLQSNPFGNAIETQSQNSASATSSHGSNSVRIIVALIIILVISIIGLSAYYFLLIKQPSSAEPINEIPVENQQPINSTPDPSPITDNTDSTPAMPEENIEQPIKYSNVSYNYLPLDLNTLNQEEIKQEFVKIAEHLKSSKPGEIYAFNVVDANNNPVAFPILATASGLNLSQELLRHMSEGYFLFYFFNDNSKIRLALVVNHNNQSIVATEFQKQEKTLVKDLDFLFLNEKPEIIDGQFKDGLYANKKIRYMNLNTANDLSLDYQLSENSVVIATSKNTMRFLIDTAEKANSGLSF